MSSARTLLWQLLAFGALPAWLLAGAADWLCHRRARIEDTSGPHESALHLLLFAQIALPLLLGLWLEINAGLLVFMAVGVMAHLLTSYLDTHYAQPRRYISPVEQMVHSWLEMLPLFAWLIVLVLHREALTNPQWLPAIRSASVPLAWRVAVCLALAAACVLIIEEYLRGRARLNAPSPASAVPRP